MKEEIMKKIEIDSYIKKLKRDYIIDPTANATYLILSDNTITMSLKDSDIIPENTTKEDIIKELESILKRHIW